MPYDKFYVSTQNVDSPTGIQRIFNTIQQKIADVITTLEKISILNGAQYNDLRVNTSTTIKHKLGRMPLGYMIVRNQANTTIWDTSMTDTELVINSSAATTISIYIY